MKKYYISKGKKQEGPFTLDELKELGIDRTTLVWFEGMEEWKEAQIIDELSNLFILLPPPIKKKFKIKLNNSFVAKEIKYAIKCIVISLIFSIIFIICNAIYYEGNQANKLEDELIAYCHGKTNNAEILSKIIEFGNKHSTLYTYYYKYHIVEPEDRKLSILAIYDKYTTNGFPKCYYTGNVRRFEEEYIEIEQISFDRTLFNTQNKAYGTIAKHNTLIIFLILLALTYSSKYLLIGIRKIYFALIKSIYWVQENSKD